MGVVAVAQKFGSKKLAAAITRGALTLAVFSAVLLIGFQPAHAQMAVYPFDATTNFALLETQSPFVAEYSTDSGADWNVLAWGQQGGPIWKPFTITNPSSKVRKYTSATLKTANDPMSVTFQSNPTTGAWTSTTLGQTATTYCGSSPQEFDLFLQPNDPTFIPANPSGILPASSYPGGVIPNLEQITVVEFQGKVKVVSASQSTSKPECGVNQSGTIASLILSSTGGQTLFYQLDLSVECYPGTDKGVGCYGYPVQEYFFSGSNPYGIDDPITSYGQNLLNPGDSISMTNINIATRLKDLIIGGSPDGKMDTNPADWQITDMYVGQHSWGRANLKTQWSGEFLLYLEY